MSDSAAPRLYATPQTLAELAAARGAAALIGGYDGSGNYGDLVQLDAAVALLERFESGVLALPVLERSRRADHDAMRDDLLHPPRRALYFDPEAAGGEDGLLPVPAPAALGFAAVYLYGGGYLNRSWGERKLAMLRASEALLAAGGAPTLRLASGLQASADWVASLAPGDRERMRSFELLGARDPASAVALATLGSEAAVIETGDDAVGVFRRLALPAPPRRDESVLRVNLHLAEHPWVTARPGSMAGFYADFVGELARHARRPAIVQPLLAYRDRYVDDAPALENLRAACASRGLTLAEPRRLRPAGLTEAVTAMRDAALTLSCSYHVALTSLLFGVPAVLLRDNEYYEQKAAGLRAAFDLPPAFGVSSAGDPRAAAAGVAAALGGEEGDRLAARLALAAGETRERRAAAEAELLSRLGGAATAALGGALADAAERLRERSAEPAALQAELAALRPSDDGAPEGVYLERDDGALEAELHAAQVRLDVVLNSRSWRLTEPLRGLGARLRRTR